MRTDGLLWVLVGSIRYNVFFLQWFWDNVIVVLLIWSTLFLIICSGHDLSLLQLNYIDSDSDYKQFFPFTISESLALCYSWTYEPVGYFPFFFFSSCFLGLKQILLETIFCELSDFPKLIWFLILGLRNERFLLHIDGSWHHLPCHLSQI